MDGYTVDRKVRSNTDLARTRNRSAVPVQGREQMTRIMIVDEGLFLRIEAQDIYAS